MNHTNDTTALDAIQKLNDSMRDLNLTIIKSRREDLSVEQISLNNGLMAAVDRESVLYAGHFIKNGAHVNYECPILSSTVLVHAVHVKSAEILNLLLDSGANINLKTKQDLHMSPFREAVISENLQMMTLLRDRGAAINHDDFLFAKECKNESAAIFIKIHLAKTQHEQLIESTMTHITSVENDNVIKSGRSRL